MKNNFSVKEIMIPTSDYATISKNANLLQAMVALEKSNQNDGQSTFRHYSVLVTNRSSKVIGKISQVDIMAALEPNYKKMGSNLNLQHVGFSMNFLKAVQSSFKLWERPVSEMFNNLKKVKVSDVMYTPADHQIIEETDTLETAMHQMVMGRHHSLLVTRRNAIVGILRSTELFMKLYNILCSTEQQ